MCARGAPLGSLLDFLMIEFMSRNKVGERK